MRKTYVAAITQITARGVVFQINRNGEQIKLPVSSQILPPHINRYLTAEVTLQEKPKEPVDGKNVIFILFQPGDLR